MSTEGLVRFHLVLTQRPYRSESGQRAISELFNCAQACGRNEEFWDTDPHRGERLTTVSSQRLTHKTSLKKLRVRGFGDCAGRWDDPKDIQAWAVPKYSLVQES